MNGTLLFSKYQATGNDFIVVEDLDDQVKLDADDVARILDRRFGIGADGLIRVTAADTAEGPVFTMDLRNSDGSVAEMSGNGIRCLGAFLYDMGQVEGPELDVLTLAGTKRLQLSVSDATVLSARVSMGEPRFGLSDIPMKGPDGETFEGRTVEIGGGLTATGSAVSMGNPHLVLFVDEDPAEVAVETIGPKMERHEWFPERANIEFARVASDGARIDVRVWERGVGETLACGTGACAVAVAAERRGLTGPQVDLSFPGGTLHVEHSGQEVFLSGPVSHVFDGAFDL